MTRTDLYQVIKQDPKRKLVTIFRCGQCTFHREYKHNKWQCALANRDLMTEAYDKFPDWCPLPDYFELAKYPLEQP